MYRLRVLRHSGKKKHVNKANEIRSPFKRCSVCDDNLLYLYEKARGVHCTYLKAAHMVTVEL